MRGKKGSSVSAGRTPESRRSDRSGWPAKKPVSYVLISDDDSLGSSRCDDTLNLKKSGSENARVLRSGGRGARRVGDGGNSCGENTNIVVVDGNVGGGGRICMEIAGVGAHRRRAGDGDDVLLLSRDGCIGLAGGAVGGLEVAGSAGENAGPLNKNRVDVRDFARAGLRGGRVGELVGSCPMSWDVSGVDPDYKLFLDSKAHFLEVLESDGLPSILAYEGGASVSRRGQPRLQETRGARNGNGEKVNAGSVGGLTRPQASHGSGKQDGKQADRVWMNYTRNEHMTAQGDRGPNGRKRELGDVSTGREKGSHYGKKRALEPVTCKPDLQASKLLAAESGSLQNCQVQNEVMRIPDESYLIFFNSLSQDGNQLLDVSAGVKKGSQVVKRKGALGLGTCQLNLQESKLIVAESAGLQNFHVQNKVMPYQIVLRSLKKDGNNPSDFGMTEKVVHGQKNQSSSDSDVIILDSNPSKKGTPLVVLDGEEMEVDSVHGTSDCSHRRQLLELLKRPYSKSELKDCMKEFRLRKPLLGYRELRSGHKTYNTEFLGRSYEDWHGDLADQIRSSKEGPKTLNLLRGFFYWLQHAGRGFVEKPWKDPACLAVLPAVIKRA